MKKRILAVLMAFTVLVSLLAVPSFAVSYDSNNDVQKFIKGVENILAGGKKFYDGEITAEEFATHYAEDIVRLDLTAADLVTCGGFSDFVQAVCGCTPAQALGISDYFTDYSQHHGGGSTSGRREFDQKGYGAVAINYCNGEIYKTMYGSYGIIYPNRTYQIVIFPDASSNVLCEYASGSSYTSSSSTIVGYLYDTNGNSYTLYGDWRYDDSINPDDYAPVGDLITDNPIIPPTIQDPQDIDLYEFMIDFLNKLDFQYPDLSTVEGLLTSILNGLSNIDSDDDGALLSQINLAIVSLAADSNLANAQIINCLNDLKELLTPKPPKSGEGGEDSGEGETTPSSVDLEPIIEQLTKANSSLDYLCLINTVDVVGDNVTDLTDTEKEFLDKYATFIVSLIKKFGLEPINDLLTSLGSIIFNDNPPAPLVVNMYGSDITFLSPDMFTPEAEQYIGYAQIFISILLVYSFCLMMRKKIVGEG